MVYSLAQSQYLDEYIFKVAEGISPHHGNLAVGTLESIAGVTKLLVAWICLDLLGDLGGQCQRSDIEIFLRYCMILYDI